MFWYPSVKRADEAATATSHASAIENPAPAATPLTAATPVSGRVPQRRDQGVQADGQSHELPVSLLPEPAERLHVAPGGERLPRRR